MTGNRRAFTGRTVKIAPEQQLESGLLYFRTGDNYRQAAIACGGRFRDPLVAINHAEEWVILHDPLCNLIGHATELYLKAFLLTTGRTTDELKKREFGHKLMNSYEEAKRHGLVLETDQLDALISLSRQFGEAPYIFRYPGLGKRNLNFLDCLFDLLDSLRDATFPIIINHARSMGTPIED